MLILNLEFPIWGSCHSPCEFAPEILGEHLVDVHVHPLAPGNRYSWVVVVYLTGAEGNILVRDFFVQFVLLSLEPIAVLFDCFFRAFQGAWVDLFNEPLLSLVFTFQARLA